MRKTERQRQKEGRKRYRKRDRDRELESESKKVQQVPPPVADFCPGQVKTQCLVHGVECVGGQLYGHFHWTLE